MKKYVIIIMLSVGFSLDETILINSSSFTDWKYFIFEDGKINEVEIINPDSSLYWDIGVMRNHFKTNSGKSGIGVGGVLVDSSSVFTNENWNDLTEIDGFIDFSQDGMLDNIYDIITHTYSEAPGSLIFETWGWFDFDNNYQFNINNYKYILRISDGSAIVKIWIQDYYNELGQSAHITLRYSTDMLCTYDICGICGGDGTLCYEDCPADVGDFNGDSSYNVLDIVALMDCVLEANCESFEYHCAGDINNDGSYNILDVVALVNCILESNCG
tara:strand:- start:2869 stop:3684 length:816 start_codon:yes stop_codon:yes gene_type:complete